MGRCAGNRCAASALKNLQRDSSSSLSYSFFVFIPCREKLAFVSERWVIIAASSLLWLCLSRSRSPKRLPPYIRFLWTFHWWREGDESAHCYLPPTSKSHWAEKWASAPPCPANELPNGVASYAKLLLVRQQQPPKHIYQRRRRLFKNSFVGVPPLSLLRLDICADANLSLHPAAYRRVGFYFPLDFILRAWTAYPSLRASRSAQLHDILMKRLRGSRPSVALCDHLNSRNVRRLTVGRSGSGVQAVQVVSLAENTAFVQGEFFAGAQLASAGVARKTG